MHHHPCGNLPVLGLTYSLWACPAHGTYWWLITDYIQTTADECREIKTTHGDWGGMLDPMEPIAADYAQHLADFLHAAKNIEPF